LGVGRSGAIIAHNSSSSSGFAISVPFLIYKTFNFAPRLPRSALFC
jgi:hypothetical protein